MTDKHVDEVTGTETTGHEWDGIRELNNPLPRWWVWTFYVTIAWALIYSIAMPAWPYMTGFTQGVLGASQRAQVHEALDEVRAKRAAFADRIAGASLEEIRTDQELLEFSLAGGRSAFAVNCSQCHGGGAQGFEGYPNLNDDDWIWGGDMDNIATTIRYGIRSGHDEGRENEMPAFGADEILEREEIGDVAEYVLALSGRAEDDAAAERGKEIFAEQCAACHGEDGKGDMELGAPNLADAIALYGADRQSIVRNIYRPRLGVMPAFEERLDEATIKQLAVYIHSLGGGQ